MTRLLLLGGTSEASQLARRLADTPIPATFSYAGRTLAPAAQPLPTRIGGFGGSAGLAAYIRAQNISHVIDATHPFAARISQNAIAACAETGTPLLGFERAPWQPGAGDRWRHVQSVQDAPSALPPPQTQPAARVFLAIGKQQLDLFAAQTHHHYLVRLVDPPAAPLPLRHAEVVIARGPFTEADDSALLRRHAISHIVAKNSGGTGAEAKLLAARVLGIEVIMIDRPDLPARATCDTTGGVFEWLRDHGVTPDNVAPRGV
ncbi:cobalt-precorrin-6A reductase [Phaeobacter sp. J2-8]|uniref:cobalt-precorrin-6A reductase n=1 Tax=Phaeobacter sp. J2-8 TaxID=2931394 RepID=UPI001FCF8E0A|nr:cobalt-precorrin-6A reductase [Phaeobacter sp. J2-8]MCJ7874449.1 cobalt-precorrin-6A reductase [Phaeobacter sp. J2-8]